MAVHEKTSKWFNDCVKRERHRRNKCSLKQGKTAEKEKNQSVPAHYSQCCYCVKVFYDAKFVVKHMLRRHSDKLVELHKNMLSVVKSEKIIHESPDLFEFLKAEFFDLKVEVDYIKKALVDHMYNENDLIPEKKSDNKSSKNKKSPDFDSTAVSTKSDFLKYKHAETSANIPSNQILPDDFRNLQVRVDKLFQMFRESVVSKEDLEKTLALNEERICRTLKNELLTEIQSILLNYQKKNKDEYKAHYLELQREVDKLEKAVQLNSKKIESPDCLHEIQSKFESRIQNLLTSHSLFTSDAKRIKVNKRRNSINEQKISLHKPKRQVKSIYTSKFIYNKNSDLSGINQEKDFFHSSLRNRRNQRHFEGTYTNGESILPPLEYEQLKPEKQGKLHEFNSLNNSDNFTEKHLQKVKLIMDEKLKSLNIDPSTDNLSNEEFEKKMRLINSEKELLEKKYENFSQIRDELDSRVNKLIKSKLRKKVPKRLRFSDSPSLHSRDSIDCDSSVKISHTAKKQESSGFILSSDLNAQGDSLAFQNIDVESLPPIQENGEDVSEGSYTHTHYPHQSSSGQQNDYESFKKYISASPIEYMVKNTATKKSTDLLLQKSVQEMSDLSSLESDILEDECDNLKGTV